MYIYQTTNLHFRGARIFSAVMEELLAKGLEKAENVRDIDDLTLFFFLLIGFFFQY